MAMIIIELFLFIKYFIKKKNSIPLSRVYFSVFVLEKDLHQKNKERTQIISYTMKVMCSSRHHLYGLKTHKEQYKL